MLRCARRDLLDELQERVRLAVALPVRIDIRDAFDSTSTELLVTANLDSGARGRPRVTFVSPTPTPSWLGSLQSTYSLWLTSNVVSAPFVGCAPLWFAFPVACWPSSVAQACAEQLPALYTDGVRHALHAAPQDVTQGLNYANCSVFMADGALLSFLLSFLLLPCAHASNRCCLEPCGRKKRALPSHPLPSH